jgi:hypothetical protein
MAEPLSLTTRVLVVSPPYPVTGVPMVGNRGSLACLEVDGQPLLQGNRSRVVLLGWQVVALLHRIDEEGKGERPTARVVGARGGPNGEGVSEWIPSHRGRLHHVHAFGADLVAVRSGDGGPPLGVMPIQFDVSQRIEMRLAGLRPNEAATLVLLGTEPMGSPPVIRRPVRQGAGQQDPTEPLRNAADSLPER